MTDYKLEIWTDGACKGNPGIGGWGALLKYGPHQKELYGGEPQTTNNRMEMTAVIEALKQIRKPVPIHLYVDSQYVKNGLTTWLPNWIKKNWKTSDNKPVKNMDLWKALMQETERHEIHWHWVKGHDGNAGNERADELANQGVALVRSRQEEAGS